MLRIASLALALIAAFGATPIADAAEGEARLLRFPHIQGDRIAFTHGGDIWTASAKGGPARRLTSFNDGYELYPRISPDGQWVAFSGQYNGTRQIFLVPFDGGEPRQLTFYPDVGEMPPRGGYDNLPLDWTPDGKKILVRMNRTPYGQRVGRYFLVDAFEGGLETPLQIPEGGPATLSPDGTKVAYSIISREWRTWKRYKAGRAQDIWIYDLKSDEIERLTSFEGTDNHAMWLGDRVYFTSDRTGTLNIYAYDLATKATRQITDFDDFDVLFPARGKGGLIFECGGYLYTMDAKTEAVEKLTIQLTDDRPWLRDKWVSGAGNIGSYDIAPKGNRVAVEVRGDLFSVPKKNGQPTNLTQTPTRRERDVHWSPDGKTLSYLAEVGDDYELFLRDVRTGEERQATFGTGAWILSHQWSPDSKRIAFTDRALRLLVLNVETLELIERDRGQEDMISEASWSGDSKWLTYTKQGANGFRSIWVVDAEAGTPRQVTSDWFNDGSPAFDPEGKYLYFASARDFNYGDLDFGMRLYALLLRPDVENPLAPQEDIEPLEDDKEEDGDKAEPASDGDGDDGEAAEADGSADETTTEDTPVADESSSDDTGESDVKADDKDDAKDEGLEIEFDGLMERLIVLPMGTGRYFNLQGVSGGFLFVSGGNLQRYSLKGRSASTVLSGVGGYMTNRDASKMVYRSGRGLAICGTTAGQSRGSNPVPVDRIRLKIDPRDEWNQIYGDAWRIMRDWFYDPQMHRVDWRGMREKHRPLLDHVAHRDDLDFILGELIGELNVGHAYVNRGESPSVTRVGVGVLGAELAADGDHYKITHIYRGEAWDSAGFSPLAAIGVDAHVGDYLLQIDGETLTTKDNPYRLLTNKVGVQVKLLLNDKPDVESAREVVVTPTGSETQLRYLDWARRNREIVDELSGGRIGYAHVPNTADQGHRRLVEGFRAQARVKEAFVIDDRYNGGGHIPERMIQEIGSPVLSYWSRRYSQLDTTPNFAFEGPMNMLINGYSSSGGDCFPFYFRRMGLGDLIGQTTWGGLVGYSGTPGFVDGGSLAVPAFSFVNPQGEWDVEYFGVAPDHEVFDDPTLIQAGRQPMLEFAVKQLLEKLEATPTAKRPRVPVGPDRSK